MEIATHHLLPEQSLANGLQINTITFDKEALVKIIQEYTRESGVRKLKNQLAGVCRKIAKAIAMGEPYSNNVTTTDVVSYLGNEIFDREQYLYQALAGVVTGLAWTPVGGEILFIECIITKGKGRLTLSGQLGSVMKESATAAFSYLKSIAKDWQLTPDNFNHNDLHLHVPAGAVPKDGPSAGIAMLTALTSVFTGRKVKSHLAMTGEITLTGRVLPVGGIKEKILAAKRAGIKEIILCQKNKKDVEEINQAYLKDLTFYYVSYANEVLKIALE